MPTHDSQREFRNGVLLSVQRALVGEITPVMRAVEVEIERTRVLIRVFTDGDVPEDVRKDFDAGAITQVVADFPDPENGDPQVAFELVAVPSPAAVPVRGVLVFALAGTR